MRNSGRCGAGSANGSVVVPRSTWPGATSFPIWVMLWQNTQELRTGLPKPIGELIPALSVIRKVLSRNTRAPRATDARKARCAGVSVASSAPGFSQAANSLHTGLPMQPSCRARKSASSPGRLRRRPTSSAPPEALRCCAVKTRSSNSSICSHLLLRHALREARDG